MKYRKHLHYYPKVLEVVNLGNNVKSYGHGYFEVFSIIYKIREKKAKPCIEIRQDIRTRILQKADDPDLYIKSLLDSVMQERYGVSRK